MRGPGQPELAPPSCDSARTTRDSSRHLCDVPTPDRAGPAARVSLERAVGPEALGLYEAALARLRPAERRAVRDRIELQRPYGRLARELGLANAAEARAVVVRALGRLLSRMGA